MSEHWFSRITLREGAEDSHAFWKTFRDPYALHQSIWSLFADGPERTRDFLYHLVDSKRPPVIYAASARRPAAGDSPWKIDVKKYDPRLMPGLRLEFMLRANPVVTRAGKRHDVVMDAKKTQRELGDAQVACSDAEIIQDAGGRWLAKRAELCGFRLLGFRADGYRQHFFAKRKQQNPLRFSTVDFTGLVEVLDPIRFRKTLYDGIGHARGLGCGLMLVKSTASMPAD